MKINMRTYFERDYIAIHYKMSDRILIVEFRLPPTSEEFRTGMDHVIHAIAHFNTGRVIFDTRRFGICLDDDQKWVAEIWYPRALKAGYSQVAFVIPQDPLTIAAVEETTQRIRNRIPTSSFEYLTDAIEWMVFYE